jgi:predicted AAA+ superfamily ATPase
MKASVRLPFVQEIERNLEKSPQFLQILLGPRQVGKTTTLLQYLEEKWGNRAHYVSADETLSGSPEWIREVWASAEKSEKLLVIDEIQKCENWAETIKALWDESKRRKKNQKCILLGSSSLLIQKGLNESLTGRFQLTRAYHWNFQESENGYSLSFEDFLKFGGYPGSYSFLQNAELGEKDWIAYVRNSILNTVLEKDILQYHTVKSPALFKQAFEIIISYPAQEISYTKLLGQIQDKGNVELVKHYIHLFEGAFLIRALEKYSEKKIRTKTSSPKILPLAPSFYYLTLLAPYTSEEKGHAFELVVGSVLNRTGENLYYWREGNAEVDFVLQRGKSLWAIEVKSGRKKSQKGLAAFRERYPHSKTVIITLENYFEFEADPLLFLEKY